MFITSQQFNEVPDGVRVDFTTAKDFVQGTLFVTQGGIFVDNYQYGVDNHSIQFDSAPDPANGALLWAGILSFGDPGAPSQFPDYTLTGPWDVATFLLWNRYEPEHFSPLISFVNWDDFQNFIGGLLSQAEDRLQIYLQPSDNFYDRGTAEPVVAGDEGIAAAVKEAISIRVQQFIQKNYNVISPGGQDLSEQTITFEGAGQTKLVYKNPDQGSVQNFSLVGLPENQMFDALFVSLLDISSSFGVVTSLHDLPYQNQNPA